MYTPYKQCALSAALILEELKVCIVHTLVLKMLLFFYAEVTDVIREQSWLKITD